MLDSLFLLTAKIGLSIFALIVSLRFIFVPYLWFRYDRPVEKLLDGLDGSKKGLMDGAAGRGITTAGLAPQIAALERPILQEVERLKLKRQHFLDRINLFLSLSSLGK